MREKQLFLPTNTRKFVRSVRLCHEIERKMDRRSEALCFLGVRLCIFYIGRPRNSSHLFTIGLFEVQRVISCLISRSSFHRSKNKKRESKTTSLFFFFLIFGQCLFARVSGFKRETQARATQRHEASLEMHVVSACSECVFRVRVVREPRVCVGACLRWYETEHGKHANTTHTQAAATAAARPSHTNENDANTLVQRKILVQERPRKAGQNTAGEREGRIMQVTTHTKRLSEVPRLQKTFR